MINPIVVIKVMNEKTKFIQNHPTFYSFLAESFGEGMSEGTVIEIKVKKPNGVEISDSVEVRDGDVKIFSAVQEFFN